MHIQKLEFFVNPHKLYAYLNDGKRKGKIVMLQDATEKGYTILAYGDEVFSEKIQEPNRDKLRKVCEDLSGKLALQYERLNEYLKDFQFIDEISCSPFLYGLIGFFSYDAGLGFENIVSKCTDDQNYPSYYFIVPKEVVILDHVNKCMWIVFASELDLEDEDFFENLRNIHFKESEKACENEMAMSSNLTKGEYVEKLLKVKEYLEKGETYQVNFSQRFCFDSHKSPWEIYKSVTEINPTKYQVFLNGYTEDSGGFSVVSNSPERLFKISYVDNKRKIETRPIKGTSGIRGGETAAELKLIGDCLVQSDKDRAELEMIVDMSRNDLGRVCEFGTVQVDEHRIVERYSHLLHTASNISGILKSNVKLYDVMRAIFPGASITGCPKKRTMEIIDELEDFSRGVYCGSFGYFDCRGMADFNIMIRTLFAKNRGELFKYVMHSGGGIVMDSIPELEFNETFDKVNAFLEVINMK
ncbi:MAG: anthranilate synthase component I family protein [Candidatus Peregrinibacteria bacterium]|nr:anthranilate synthase component I family protein [Candidatus Peregrinibacteria bacterium]MDZ4245269.1 anthranilate synthase component I family protein [Candidatus Gracilibacteria bacterium]